MPHLTLSVDQRGPMMLVGLGVSESMRHALNRAGKTLPQLQPANALIDTGASCSVVDPEVIKPLGLNPTSYASVHTPSTGGNAAQQPVYDISIWLFHAQSQHVVDRSFPVCCANLRAQGIDMLLGRDVLGDCLLVYDGPSGQFSIAF